MTDQHIFVGAPAALDKDSLRTGAVYVFEKVGDEWIERTKLIADDIQKNDGFFQVKVFEQTLYIGASKAAGNNLQYKGAVYLFEKIGDEWIQTHKLIPEDGTNLDKNLWTFNVNENYIALSNSDNSQYSTVYLFQKKGDDWEQINVLSGVPEDIDRYGRAVDITDKHLFVGAWASFYQNSDNLRTGAVYVYDLDILVSTEDTRLTKDYNLSLSPNPTQDILTVTLKDLEAIRIESLEVYSISGQLLQLPKKSIRSDQCQVSTAGLNAGTYIVKVYTNQGEFVQPFVKM